MELTRDPAQPLHGGVHLYANAWPAFATDTAPLAAAVLLEADAPSEIYDHLFANRFACAAGFAAMGADCQAQGRTLHIAGGAHLGGGGNAVNRMVRMAQGVEFVTAVNTDKQALNASSATYTKKVQIGDKLTKGQGAGADPEVGQRAAEESRDQIAKALEGHRHGVHHRRYGRRHRHRRGPWWRRSPVRLGILTVGVVTKPFAFEGKRR